MITLWLDYQTANTVLLMLHNTCLLSRELMSNDNTLEYAFSLTAPEAHSPILIGATSSHDVCWWNARAGITAVPAFWSTEANRSQICKKYGKGTLHLVPFSGNHAYMHNLRSSPLR